MPAHSVLFCFALAIAACGNIISKVIDEANVVVDHFAVARLLADQALGEPGVFLVARVAGGVQGVPDAGDRALAERCGLPLAAVSAAISAQTPRR